MSLYNMINGYNPACVWIMPLLGRKEEEYPRFRDCFVNDDNRIVIYTRVGGFNRGCGYGEEELYKDPNFVTTFDDEYDNTYGYYVFNVPGKWEADFRKILEGKFSETSSEYQALMRETWKKLDEKGLFDTAFSGAVDTDFSEETDG